MKDIKSIIDKHAIKAVIFDLDGTMLDNNPYHLKSWKQYLSNLGREITDDEYKANINGRTNRDAVEYIYGRKMDEDEAMKYTLEKEEIYRELYNKDIKPVEGLIDVLKSIDLLNLPMAIATSGIPVNIEFMFDNIPIRKYFKTIVNSTHITKGKPDPEIYLRTAELLSVDPLDCLVFEDSLVGIRSAKLARMKVIAVATTHSANELSEGDYVIKDFTELALQQVAD
jgi:HAD superfamily hydrolase (TIGR01509 family)